ncbi:MAG: hypothetical protein J7523_09580, partial [Cellulomonas sp.]|nr:hypothetical protein [Cellulomonas sp.]
MRLRTIAATVTAALVTPLLLSAGAPSASTVPGTAPAEPLAAPTVAPDATVVGPPATQTRPLDEAVYSATGDVLVAPADGTQVSVPLTPESWRDVGSIAGSDGAPTTSVSYGSSPTVYAVTSSSGSETWWQRERLTSDGWASAGYPTSPATGGGSLVGSTYHRWSTSNELFVTGGDGVTHKLSVREWAAVGYPAFVTRAGGFYKRLSTPGIFRGSSDDLSSLTPITAAEWAAEGFPTPATLPEPSGDIRTDSPPPTPTPAPTPTTSTPTATPTPTPTPTPTTPPSTPATVMPDATNTGV